MRNASWASLNNCEELWILRWADFNTVWSFTTSPEINIKLKQIIYLNILMRVLSWVIITYIHSFLNSQGFTSWLFQNHATHSTRVYVSYHNITNFFLFHFLYKLIKQNAFYFRFYKIRGNLKENSFYKLTKIKTWFLKAKCIT